MGPYDDIDPQLRVVGGMDWEKGQLGIPPQNRGVRFTRVLEGHHPQDNTRKLELGFAKEWSDQNGDGELLASLLLTDKDDPRRSAVPSTPREWEVARLVAATIIQWLPTSVGCSFLRGAFENGGGEFNYRLPDENIFMYRK